MFTVVQIIARPAATLRTKNRIREHHGHFRLEHTPARSSECAAQLFAGRAAVRYSCMCHEHVPCPWSGWLPADEIAIVQVTCA